MNIAFNLKSLATLVPTKSQPAFRSFEVSVDLAMKAVNDLFRCNILPPLTICSLVQH